LNDIYRYIFLTWKYNRKEGKSKMPLDIPRVQEVCKDLEGTHKFLAEELLIPNLNKCDSVRVNMFDNHLPQALVLENPDFPNVFTNFENQVGKYSTG